MVVPLAASFGPGFWLLVLLVLGWEVSRSTFAAAELWPFSVVMSWLPRELVAFARELPRSDAICIDQ